MELIIHTFSEEETEKLGFSVGQKLFPGALLLLEGELGAGKTVFARGVGRGLGVKNAIGSPTFTILRVYEGKIPFYHFDLYRLEDEEELFELGLEEYLDSDGVTLVEWAAKFEEHFPAAALMVTLAREDDEHRTVNLSARGAVYEEVLEFLRPAAGERC